MFEKTSLADSVEDNGFAVQNKYFDFLLNTEGNVIQPKDGQVYIPVFYWKEGIAEVGDKLTVYGKEFTVAGLTRDSLMNSPLAGSKRILVSQNDYEDLREYGMLEYLIEFRLKDMADTGKVESEYMSAGLESNGPMISYRNVILINGLTDGMVIGIILLIALLVTGIAFLCIRFTLLAKIEDEYREIGTMKAIGIRISDIKKLYLAKYTVITAAGCIMGFGFSFVLRGKMTENIRLFMGESSNAFYAPAFSALGVLLVLIAILLYVNHVLKLFKKISAAEALRFGMTQEKKKRFTVLRLSNSRILPINVFLGVKDVWNRKKIYTTMFIILLICSFIILVPQNLSNTISSKEFMTYIGIGNGQDFGIYINQLEGKEEKADEIEEALKKDDDVAKYTVFSSRIYKVVMDDGAKEQIRVEIGDHSLFPVSCYEGRLPDSEHEIALSGQNAEALGKKTGDTILINIGEENKELTVSGVYSDVQNGGKTAKATFTDTESETWFMSIPVQMKDTAKTAAAVSKYADKFPDAGVRDGEDTRIQVMGDTMESIELVSRIAFYAALFLTALITVLFMKMLIAKDRYAIAVLKASGFTKKDIMIQYVSRFIFILFAGILLGSILANVLGEQLTLAATSPIGVRYLRFLIDPVSAYIITPLLMLISTLLAMVPGIRNVGKVMVMGNINE